MSEKIEWNDDYLLGIQEIDNQHKKLVAIANELYDITTGSEESYKLDMSKVLKNLTDYTVYHFSSEEEFMKRYGYAGVDLHKTAHDGFINEVTNQIKLLNDCKIESGKKFYSFVLNWVLTHIAKADKIWANLIKDKIK
jgi:hemerythrin